MRKLGFAGAPMNDGLLQSAVGRVQAGAVRQSLRLVRGLHLQHRPGRDDKARQRGRAGINQRLRVVKLDAAIADELAAVGEEGQIIADLPATKPSKATGTGPTPNAKSLRDGWYFTGDTGYFDADGDLFVTGRVDDMIISGGENISPVDIERCCRCIRPCRKSRSPA